MEASTSTRKRAGSSLAAAMFSTRRGSIMTAVVAALLAGIILFAFVQNYHKSSAPPVVNTPVFVASAYIPKGTPVSVIASGSLMSRTTVPSTHVVTGAIVDPSAIKGEVAANPIYPGQQLTAADFSSSDVTITSQLTGSERAIAIPVDPAHGLIGFVQAGDRVDVLNDGGTGQAGKSSVSVVATNILVLSAPGATGSGAIGGGGSSGGNLVLQVTPTQAEALAAAADNGKIWITLRPPVGALGTTNANGKK
jgi:Flp pilus assembly protein CpaB